MAVAVGRSFALSRASDGQVSALNHEAVDAYGFVWVYSEEGKAPPFERIPEYESRRYGWTTSGYTVIHSWPLPVLENTIDHAHLGPVHGKACDWGEYEFLETDNPRRLALVSRMRAKAIGRVWDVVSEVEIIDGTLITGLLSIGPCRNLARWITAPTPIDQRSMMLATSCTVRHPKGLWLPVSPIAQLVVGASVLRGAIRLDAHAWEHQERAAGSLYTPQDAGFMHIRRYYEALPRP